MTVDQIPKEEILQEFLNNFDVLYGKYPGLYEKKLRERITEVVRKNFNKGKQLLKIIADSEQEKFQKSVISQETLRKIISQFPTHETTVSSEHRFLGDIYCALEHCANGHTRLEFLKHHLNIIQNDPQLTNPAKEFALEMLEKTTPPDPLRDNEVARQFLNIMSDLTKRLTDQNHKLKAIKVQLKYLPVLPENVRNQLINNSIIPFMDSDRANPAEVGQILEEITYEKTEVYEDIWNSLRQKSLDLRDPVLIDKVFRHYINNGEVLATYFHDLLEADVTKAITALLENKDHMAEEIVVPIFEHLLEKSRTTQGEILKHVLNAIKEIFPKLGQEHKDRFGDRLIDLIANLRDQQGQVIALEVLRETKESFSNWKKEYIARQLADALPRIEEGFDINALQNLLDGLFVIYTSLPKEVKEKLTDYLLRMVSSESSPKPHRLKGFEYLRRMEEIPESREETAIKQLMTILKTSSDEDIVRACKETIRILYEKSKRSSLWQEADKLLREEDPGVSQKS